MTNSSSYYISVCLLCSAYIKSPFHVAHVRVNWFNTGRQYKVPLGCHASVSVLMNIVYMYSHDGFMTTNIL